MLLFTWDVDGAVLSQFVLRGTIVCRVGNTLHLMTYVCFVFCHCAFNVLNNLTIELIHIQSMTIYFTLESCYTSMIQMLTFTFPLPAKLKQPSAPIFIPQTLKCVLESEEITLHTIN